METNRIGKFEMRTILNEFDSALIQLFGVNMTDARITRQYALIVTDEVECPRKAAEICGQRLGLRPLSA
jgi:hypothetical protein